jgi:hypothetical protein
VVESCRGSFDIPSARGFEVKVECARWSSRALFTITVKTEFFADFEYPVRILVRVDPPNGLGDNATAYLWFDGDYYTFDWPADFSFLHDPVTGTYEVTVEASNASTILWVTIASGAFIIQ